MSNFGGFATNRDLSTWLQANSVDFAAMVVSYSSLLKPYLTKLDELTRVTQRQVYPRIGLILAAAKNADNTYLFADSTDTTDMNKLYENVISLMTAEGSPFSEGITNVAACMTAAILIKQLPINSDIKNIDLGNELEKGAIADLDRIVHLYRDTVADSLSVNVKGIEVNQTTIYVALDINKNTLPASYFDVAPVDQAIQIETAYPAANVTCLETLNIPSSKVAFGWYYISSTEGESKDSSGNSVLVVKPPIENAFFVRDGYTPDDLVEILAEELNSLTLQADANIISSPNRGELSLRNVALPKKKLYDSADNTYDKKTAIFKLLQQVNYLSFDARRMSTIVSRELIILRFFSADKVNLASQSLASALPSSTVYTYQGDWNAAIEYTVGDVVDLGSNSVYCCILTGNLGKNPSSPTNVAFWRRIYSEAGDLIARRNLCDGFIDGLVYGLSPSYTFLDKRGPKSLTLKVEKATVKSVTTADSSATATEDKYTADTFYFRMADGALSLTGDLRIRVSSTNLADFPEIVPLLAADGSLKIPLTGFTSAEDAALEALKALYKIGQFTDVLAALVQPAALQLTAFKKTQGEIKEVIDILQLPDGLEVATGIPATVKTEYRARPRSLIITAQSIKDNLINTTSDSLPNNKDYGVASTAKGQKSQRIQNVYDRLDFLKNMGRYPRDNRNAF